MAEPIKDGKILHFLKELPGWVVVSGALVFFTVIYLNTKDDFIPRIIDALIGAFLGLVVGQRPKTPQVNTDTVNTGAINDSTINTENLNEKEK